MGLRGRQRNGGGNGRMGLRLSVRIRIVGATEVWYDGGAGGVRMCLHVTYAILAGLVSRNLNSEAGV
eukprot:3932667-Rhodomonas_salina.1